MASNDSIFPIQIWTIQLLLLDLYGRNDNYNIFFSPRFVPDDISC